MKKAISRSNMSDSAPISGAKSRYPASVIILTFAPQQYASAQMALWSSHEDRVAVVCKRCASSSRVSGHCMVISVRPSSSGRFFHFPPLWTKVQSRVRGSPASKDSVFGSAGVILFAPGKNLFTRMITAFPAKPPRKKEYPANHVAYLKGISLYGFRIDNDIFLPHL